MAIMVNGYNDYNGYNGFNRFNGYNGYNGSYPVVNLSGWWYTYPSEKYEFVNGKDYPIYGPIYYGKIKHVWNHQPVMWITIKYHQITIFFRVKSRVSQAIFCQHRASPAQLSGDTLQHQRTLTWRQVVCPGWIPPRWCPLSYNWVTVYIYI